MEFLKFVVENWWGILVAAIILSAAISGAILFCRMPKNEQIKKVKEWLLLAVAQAEKELGSGTGQLKLRYVYDMFLTKFPFLVSVISFDSFKLLVEEALDVFKPMLKQNEAIKEYVGVVEEVSPNEQ